MSMRMSKRKPWPAEKAAEQLVVAAAMLRAERDELGDARWR